MGSVLFGASMCQTKACFVFTRSVCSPNYSCCPEQISSCIVFSQDHRDMGWKGSLDLVQPLPPALGLLPALVGVNSDFFSSALENLHVIPQILWADDTCINLQVHFFLCFFFSLNRSLWPLVYYFTVICTFSTFAICPVAQSA